MTVDYSKFVPRDEMPMIPTDPRKPVPLNHPFAGGNWRRDRRNDRLTRLLGGLLLVAACGALGILATWEFMAALVMSPVWRP